VARPPSDFLAGCSAPPGVGRLSQRALAGRTGVAASSIAAVETGERDAPVSTYARLLTACGWALVVTDDEGAEVRGVTEDQRRDAAGRRYPAHVELRSTARRGSWWADRCAVYWGIPPRPPWTYDLPPREPRQADLRRAG
jgi:transcriptional regulator with XRE-family HTH domain